ncbi:MAG: Nif11-like leader peptide family natural product precursor, partial [Gloeocapsa sp. DLM2.Bin57]
MSLEQATAFIDKLISDGTFRAKVEQYKGNHESVMAEAKAAGYEFTTDEISEAYRNHEQTPNLSDEQLDAIA